MQQVTKMSFQEMNALTSERAEMFAFSQADADRILFPTTISLENHPLAAEEMKNKLIRMKKKETRLHLHGYTLSEYWRNKRIPVGLRIQKKPTIGKGSIDFVKKWCEILNKCSMDLMLLVIEEVTNKKDIISKDIKDHETLMQEKLGDNFLQIDDSIKQTLKDYEDGLMTTKIRKYKRDIMDYQHGNVYKFLHERPAPQPTESALQSDSTTADSDHRSDSESSTGYPHPGGYWQSKNGRGQRGKNRGRRGVGRNAPSSWDRPNTRQKKKAQ